MRILLGGLVVLLLPVIALAQAHGQILSIGFNNHYRPDCWTPMLIQLTNDAAEATVYQIQILQEDLDRDRVIYTQEVTLGGGHSATTENFWVYFKPKPTGGGLPDALNIGTTLNTLNAQLKVFLCDKNGKQLATLPNTATVLSVDPIHNVGDPSRSRKLILFVTDGTDRPLVPDPGQKGMLQDIDPVVVQPRDLPTNVLGYDAVDTIVWMDADANFLNAGTRAPSMEAIRQWIDQGGQFVVCQPGEAFKVKPFADLLPVGEIVDGQWAIPMVDRTDIGILRQMAQPTKSLPAWPAIHSAFKVARVLPGNDAKVESWLTWPDNAGPRVTPFLARRPRGLGSVVWVAQDLGSPALTDRAKTGWRYVWDRVLGWNDPDVPEDYQPPEQGNDPWAAADMIDLGTTLWRGKIDLTSTAVGLVSIACFFFVLYGLAAGPGVYLFLAARKQAQLSWFFFGLTAVAATFITVLLVKLVLSGAPELRHLSVIRCAADQPDDVINSRFGLYIKQDGPQDISLRHTVPMQVSTITPYSQHPQYVSEDDMLPAYLQYQIPVFSRQEASVNVTIPFRSTSKKLQTRWVGEFSGRIDLASDSRDVRLVPPGNGGYIRGSLVNHSGYDLSDVYLAFDQPSLIQADPRDQTYLLYIPRWPRDGELKLQELTINANQINLDASDGRRPGGNDPAFGEVSRQWNRYWHAALERSSDDLSAELPMLALFDRMPPWQAEKNGNGVRFELFDRGARTLNLSGAVSAGDLAIFALCAVPGSNNDTGSTPLPVTLDVNSHPVLGNGTTVFQYVLPLNKGGLYSAPAVSPATVPSPVAVQ